LRISELIPFVRKMLRGRNITVMAVCMLPLLGELFFRFAEAAVYSLLLYFGELPPIALFSGKDRIQLAVSVLSALLRFVVISPLIYAAAAVLTDICAERKPASLSSILVSRRNFRRSLTAGLITRLLGAAALVPAAFFGVNAYRLLVSGHTAGELFLTFHAFVLTALAVGMWISLRISLSALPFLMAQFPDRSVVRLTFMALRIMKGRKAVFIRLMAIYLPAALTVIGIPFALTRVSAAWALCISIRMKEEEYNEGNKAESQLGYSFAPGNVPAEKTGSIKTAAYKAETSGRRHNKKRRDCPQRGYSV